MKNEALLKSGIFLRTKRKGYIMKLNDIKGIFVFFFALLSAWLGALAVPVYIMVGFNIIDYGTGLMAAPHRGETRNSYKGIQGIAKKVCMWLLVAVAAMVDVALQYAASIVKLKIPFSGTIAAVVALWIVFNELISILENIRDIGVRLPPWLLPLAEYAKKITEVCVTIPDQTKTEKNK